MAPALTVEAEQGSISTHRDKHFPTSKKHYAHHHPNATASFEHKQRTDTSLVHYDEDYEKVNSEYQVAWSEAMEQGQYRNSGRYEKAAALMIYWEPESDDLHVKAEVDELGSVFTETFNFDVNHALLKSNNGKTAQMQVNKHVSEFVYNHDAPGNLLIVYFAGHGTPGSIVGQLLLAGKRKLEEDSKDYKETHQHLDQVIWNKTEVNLQGTQSDVLQIMDTCYAGDLGPTRDNGRLSEYLAATSHGMTTKKPGPHSFTHAMIWALKELARTQVCFTTAQLLAKIKVEADGFPKEQEPVLSNRGTSTANQRIMLRPIKRKATNNNAVNGGNSDANGLVLGPPRRTNSVLGENDESVAPQQQNQDILTLKFYLDVRPSAAQLKDFGMGVNTAVRDHLLVSRIRLAGLDSRDHDLTAEMANRWLRRTKRMKAARRLSSQASNGGEGGSTTAGADTSTPTNSSSSRSSPPLPPPSSATALGQQIVVTSATIEEKVRDVMRQYKHELSTQAAPSPTSYMRLVLFNIAVWILLMLSSFSTSAAGGNSGGGSAMASTAAVGRATRFFTSVGFKGPIVVIMSIAVGALSFFLFTFMFGF